MIPDLPIDKQVALLMHGAEFGDAKLAAAMESELRERLREAARERRPLRVYTGYDPTGPDLHIGHAITLRKLRLFQQLGHDVTFLVGTFTAQVGDASDRLSGRPRKTQEDVAHAARTYAEQCYRVLDRERTSVAYNADWLAKLTLADVVSLASNFTVQQFLVRDNYRKRIDAGDPVGLHEFMYALLQGYDAVHLRADVQMGATEQLFNIQAGRKLQEAFGQKACVCLTFPILVGTDGTRRMGKSLGNYIGLGEAPENQFGKAMGVSDETMRVWLPYVTDWSPEEVTRALAELHAGSVHPMELKKRMARSIVTQYHGAEAADRGQREFERVHQEGLTPEDMLEVALAAPAPLIDVLCRIPGVPSRAEAKRLLQGSGVRIDGVTASDPQQRIDRGCVIQVGKRRFARILL